MSRKFLHFLLLAGLVAVSSLALADPPTLVGRISAAEGRVTVHNDEGEETGSLLNWPVKEGDQISTATGARTEFRVGPVAIRLDGDSALDIEELDEDVMRLRLAYGAASVRVRDPQALAGFELATPQGRVTLTEPGMVRIDTDREPDTTIVSVFMGTARVEAAGTVLNLRTGKRADIRGDDVSTAQTRQDGFDAWALARDRRDEAAIATRYIPSYVTGYEELDHYGSWTVSDDYGPLWAPRSLPADWAPYRDGRWAWVAPWGWTWVDNAPWGYAPFHYGRWVVVNRRWCWSPGRIVGRPVWAPALVGWVGGAGWSVSFTDRRHGPGMGWYPLTPRDRYVPHYQVSPDHERRLGWQFRGNDRWKAVPTKREGITIVPRDQFEQRRSVRVNALPRGTLASDRGNLPAGTPVVPAGFDRNRDGIADRMQVDRNRDGTPDRLQTDRNRDGIADRMQVDRNRDGTPDRLQTDRNRDGIADRMQVDRNRDGTPDRLQTDRNRDGIADRMQVDRNRDGTPDRVRTDRERGQSVIGTAAPALSAGPQVAPRGTITTAPSRSFIDNERLERQREMMENRLEQRQAMDARAQQQRESEARAQQHRDMEARAHQQRESEARAQQHREMESRAQQSREMEARAQQSREMESRRQQQAQAQQAQMAQQQRPVQMAPAAPVMRQPDPPQAAPAVQPRSQDRGRAERGGRPDRGENMRER